MDQKGGEETFQETGLFLPLLPSFLPFLILFSFREDMKTSLGPKPGLGALHAPAGTSGSNSTAVREQSNRPVYKTFSFFVLFNDMSFRRREGHEADGHSRDLEDSRVYAQCLRAGKGWLLLLSFSLFIAENSFFLSSFFFPVKKRTRSWANSERPSRARRMKLRP